MKLYPAIDLLKGQCVRLKQGGFDQATVYSADPVSKAREFEAAGARCLHLVDLSGARNPAERQSAAIAEIIRATELRVQVGGGLRTVEDAAGLLTAGADRVVFGSAIVTNPSLGERLLKEFGPERITLALDVRIGADGVARPAVNGWQEQGTRSALELLAELVPFGLARVLCTDIARDGMMAGPNLGLYRELMARFPTIEIQASGGVSCLNDLLELNRAGLRSAIVGKALYEGAIDLAEAVGRC